LGHSSRFLAQYKNRAGTDSGENPCSGKEVGDLVNPKKPDPRFEECEE
jgi:hypothetical protein